MYSFFKEHLWQILLGVNYVLVIFFSIFIVLKNSHPIRTLSYLFALAALPFIGLLVYYFFGQDYRKHKIFEKKSVLDSTKLKEWRESFQFTKRENEEFEKEFGDGIFKIYKLLQNNDKAVVTFHNKVDILLNGEQKFKVLLKDLKAAESHIHMEYFIVVDDELGQKILDILCEKAKAGVEVRLIYDDVGSTISYKWKKKLSDSGIEHHPFMPVIFTRFTGKFNYRDHRKIVVIDGNIGYVGGINLEKKYDNTYNNKVFWRDSHLRLEGDAVGSLQSTFLLNWDFVSNSKIDIKKVMQSPLKKTKHTTAVQIVASGPDTDWASIMEAMFSAINSANDYIYITSPYLIPNAEILAALTTASRSGVEVKVIIPKESDSWAAKYATNSYIEQLLDSGIKVYRYTRGFVHAKSIVIDDCLCSIGTANLDYRSFSINFEINAMIYDTKISSQMKEIFNDDLKDCEIVDIQQWRERSLNKKLKESFSRLWAPLL